MSQKKLPNFIQRLHDYDLNDDEKAIIDKMALMSNPESMSREEYSKLMDDLFDGDNPMETHDKLDISGMMEQAQKFMPQEFKDIITDQGIIGSIETEALEKAKDYHPVSLALGVSDAIYEAIDYRIPPALVMPNDASAAAHVVADTITNTYDLGESYEDSSDEDDTEEDFDDEDYDD